MKVQEIEVLALANRVSFASFSMHVCNCYSTRIKHCYGVLNLPDNT